VRKVLLVCALLAACRKSAPEEPPKAPPPPKPGLEAPVIVKELEPNDYQRAQQIPPRAVVEGTLSAPRDDDWYRVAVTGAPLALRVEVRPRGEAPLRGELEIYDRDRNRLLRVHAPGVIPAVACVESCFVKVSGAGPAPYLLTVLGAPPVAGQELQLVRVDGAIGAEQSRRRRERAAARQADAGHVSLGRRRGLVQASAAAGEPG
jgi:hypothetical protein